MITGGVDLAAQPKNTGACLVDWEAGQVEVVRGPVWDADVIDVVRRSRRTGVDVPLGWPDTFIVSITHHRNARRWPGASLEPAEDRSRLRLRTTDHVAKTFGLNPLSVSSDRIAVPAMRWARIEDQLTRAGLTVDRSGCSGKVAEVYPSGSLRMWQLDAKLDAPALIELILARVLGGLLDPNRLRNEMDGCNRHQLDAFIAAITARDVLQRRTLRPAGPLRDVARREGWIHLPRPSSP